VVALGPLRGLPIEFEYLVAALFADMGYEVAVTEERGDKGIDVIARSASEVLAIQVKQHSEGNNVGRPTVQQTIGAMARRRRQCSDRLLGRLHENRSASVERTR